MSVKITGVSVANRNLVREIKKIEGDITKGLIAAGSFAIGKSVEITPADTGNLRNTSFTSVDKNKMRVGYTAEYAPFVHEMPETFNYSTPDTGPKFLQKAIFENTRAMLSIIRKRVSR